jgi:S-(hydroxymethyl)mycothiol dehydrogenase
VVRVQACGVCHTDLTYREGGINDEFPFLLGHEATGVVDEVGAGVDSVAVGDFVILNWRAVRTVPGVQARPSAVLLRHPQCHAKETLQDRTELTPALGIGAFAEKTASPLWTCSWSCR